VKLTWHVIVLLLAFAASALAVTIKDEHRIKDSDGKTLAIVVTCSECKQGSKKEGAPCRLGVQDGFWDGEPCGQCFIKANWGHRIGYPSDLVLVGELKDAKGRPLTNQFVRLRLPNTWTVTTRTNKNGKFHMTLGATEQRKSRTSIVKELGTFTAEKTTGRDQAFTLYMLPEQFNPCAKGKK
jgi:hypothetical protein